MTTAARKTRSSRSSNPRCVSTLSPAFPLAIHPITSGNLWADSGSGRLLQHTSGNKKAEEDASKDAESKLKDIKSIGSKSGDKVVEDLLKMVTDVQPKVPQRVGVP